MQRWPPPKKIFKQIISIKVELDNSDFPQDTASFTHAVFVTENEGTL